MARKRGTERVQRGFPVATFGKCLLFSYMLTGVLLLVMALLLYKLELSEGLVSLGVVVIYIVATFCGGLVMGKCTESKKYIWGLVIGCAYFFVLLVVSFMVNFSMGEATRDLFTTWLICAGSGMIGGMLS